MTNISKELTFMKYLFILFILTASITTAQTNDFLLPEGALTLSQARQLAIANNPGVNRALKNIEAAQGVLKQVNSQKYPSITANGRYNLMDVSMQPDWAPDTRYEDSFNEDGAGINAKWLLFDGFSRRANLLSSKYSVEQSEHLHTEVQRLLLEAVTSAYIQSQLALESMAISAEDLHFNRLFEYESSKRYAAGSVPESEMLNFSVRALNSENRFMQSKRDYEVACLVLAQLMAIPNIVLTSEIRPKHYTDVAITELPNFEAEFEYACLHRPDLLAIDAQRRLLEQQVRSKKGKYAPKIDLVAGINYTGRDDMDAPDIDNRDSFVGLTASWDLFSAGRRKGEVLEANAHLDASEETYIETYLNIQSNIRQALATAAVALDIFKRSQKAYDLTLRIRNSVEKSYKAGAVSLTRMNEAQADLVRASGATAFSRLAYLQALETLASQTGRILETIDL